MGLACMGMKIQVKHGFALRLVLMLRQKRNRKWPMGQNYGKKECFIGKQRIALTNNCASLKFAIGDGIIRSCQLLNSQTKIKRQGRLRDSENKLNVPLPRTNYYRNSFSYNGATLWNSLPCDIRNIESLGVFKRKINDIL